MSKSSIVEQIDASDHRPGTGSKPPLSLLQRYLQETRKLFLLMGPILIAQLSQTALGVTDTIMAGRYAANDLAAVAIGYSFSLPLFLFVVGLSMAVTAMVAKHNGARDMAALRRVSWQGFWLSLLVSLIAAVIMHEAYRLLHWAGVAPELIAITDAYLKALAYGMPALCIVQSLRAVTDGVGAVPIYMLTGFLIFLINIPLNYMFVYGAWGAPELGGEGCAWATVIVLYSQVLMMVGLVSIKDSTQKIALFAHMSWPCFGDIRQVFRLGFPVAIAIFLEIALFSSIAILLAPLGAEVVGGHQIVMNASSVIFMLPMSLSAALSIRVAFIIGRGRDARFSAYSGISTAVLLSIVSMSVILLTKDNIISLYTKDIAITQLALSLFLLVAIYQIPDAIQVASAGALRGYHDTRVPMGLVFIAYWLIALPLGYILGRTDLLLPAMGAAGFWLALIVGLSVAAILLSWRLAAVSQVNSHTGKVA